MTFEDLTPEMKDKVKSCTSVDEIVALAKSEGVELTDDQLEAVSGGSWYNCSGFGISTPM